VHSGQCTVQADWPACVYVCAIARLKQDPLAHRRHSVAARAKGQLCCPPLKGGGRKKTSKDKRVVKRQTLACLAMGSSWRISTVLAGAIIKVPSVNFLPAGRLIWPALVSGGRVRVFHPVPDGVVAAQKCQAEDCSRQKGDTLGTLAALAALAAPPTPQETLHQSHSLGSANGGKWHKITRTCSYYCCPFASRARLTGHD